jgi:flagellar biosynthetic protein FliQ
MEGYNFIISKSQEALYLILILSAPSVAVAMVLGLMISLVQATTQVQEQTLTFVPKLVAVMVIIALTGPWCMGQLKAFTEIAFREFPKYIR